jgi:CRISPR-associated protein Cas5t
LPSLRLAIGIPSKQAPDGEIVPETVSEVCTLYQQLHSYPVGNSGQELKQRTHGSKYWIVPVRREFLVGLDIVLGIQSHDTELLKSVTKGLRGELVKSRYGLPFAGDNNFLFDRIDVLNAPPPTIWYVQMQPDDPPMRGSYRLTVGIDRADNSKTTSNLYAPLVAADSEPPKLAWTWTPREPVDSA